MERTDLVTQVVEALAEADGVEPDELDYNLHDQIDPTVLTKLASMEDGTWEFVFQVSDHQVTVTHDDRIIIDGVGYSQSMSIDH